MYRALRSSAQGGLGFLRDTSKTQFYTENTITIRGSIGIRVFARRAGLTGRINALLTDKREREKIKILETALYQRGRILYCNARVTAV